MNGPVAEAARPAASLRERAVVVLWIAASFLVFSLVRAPIPGPNEPHYLTKARHFWNPDWCPGDFFLESADTHRVFYAVFGPLAANLPFPVVAFLGRLAAHLLLAFAWWELLARIVPGQWTPLWAAWLYLGLAALGNLSGEWLVGGVEAKVFGYAFAFLAVAWLLDRRWIAASICMGLAIAWHPLVGGWSCVALGIGGLILLVAPRCSRGEANGAQPSLPSLLVAGLSILALVVCSLPGVWPAIQLFDIEDGRPQDTPWTEPVADLGFAADFIQVEHRLGHHLDPVRFGAGQRIPDDDHRTRLWGSYALLLVGWLLLRNLLPRRREEREFAAFVLGTVVIALVGVAIGFRTMPLRELPIESIEFRIGLLKFYWFRLVDIVLPMAFAATIAGWLASRVDENARVGESAESLEILGRPLESLARQVEGELAADRHLRRVWIGCAAVFLATLCFPGANGTNTNLTAEEVRQYRELCTWVRENTPADVRFRTPRSAIAFKWYAQRAEFLTGKDCPQDPAGIVEWNERSNWFAAWAEEQYADQRYSEAEIRNVSRAMDVDYFIAWHLGPVDMEPVYDIGDFRVYDVRGE